MIFEKLTSQDLRVVGESYSQAAKPAMWRNVPIAKILDAADGSQDTTYRLPALANNLVDAGLPNWTYGSEPPAPREREFSPVTLSTNYVRTPSDVLPMKRNRQDKIADLRQLGPLHLDYVNRAMDIALAAFLVDTAKFGAAVDVTGGGSTLHAFAAANVPYKAIEDAIRSNALRAKQGFFGLSLEAFIPLENAVLLAGYEEYSHLIDSGDSGARRPKAAGPGEMSSFARTFAAKHGLDRVNILTGLHNSAAEGLTEVVAKTFGNFMWIGFVDRRQELYDLTKPGAPIKPGGGLIVAVSQEPELVSYLDEGARVEYVSALAAYKFFSPQKDATGDQMGIWFNKFTA